MCLSSKAHDTPVHVAAANGQCDLLEAMTTVRTSDGQTKGGAAVWHKQNGVTLLAPRFVLHRNAQLAAERDIILPVHQRNDAGYTPVQLATTLDARRVLKPKTDKGGAALYR